MPNNSVLSFYYNFGFIFKGLEDKRTNCIENWSPTINWRFLVRKP